MKDTFLQSLSRRINIINIFMIWALQSTYHTSPVWGEHLYSSGDVKHNDKDTHKDKDKDKDNDKDKVLKRPITCYVFEKQGVQGYLPPLLKSSPSPPEIFSLPPWNIPPPPLNLLPPLPKSSPCSLEIFPLPLPQNHPPPPPKSSSSPTEIISLLPQNLSRLPQNIFPFSGNSRNSITGSDMPSALGLVQ